ncbi:MAG: hypothetical protein ACRERU_06140 [Methylococcales bacterium]
MRDLTPFLQIIVITLAAYFLFRGLTLNGLGNIFRITGGLIPLSTEKQ